MNAAADRLSTAISKCSPGTGTGFDGDAAGFEGEAAGSSPPHPVSKAIMLATNARCPAVLKAADRIRFSPAHLAKSISAAILTATSFCVAEASGKINRRFIRDA